MSRLTDVFMLLLYKSPSLTCFGIAGWLCYSSKGGWGWFLFTGLLVMSTNTFEFGKRVKAEHKDEKQINHALSGGRTTATISKE